MAKLEASVEKMPDSPRKFALAREMGMTNAEMSKGNMRGACMHYMKAEGMGGAK